MLLNCLMIMPQKHLKLDIDQKRRRNHCKRNQNVTTETNAAKITETTCRSKTGQYL